MLDPRVHKYIAWDDDGVAVGMSTLTRHLETVPWISPDFFAYHFPEHTAATPSTTSGSPWCTRTAARPGSSRR